MEQLFFDDWAGIVRTISTTVVAYIVVVFMLRISGKRTLAKMNAFDFIVTIALGSILGSVILNKSTPIAEGLTAIGLLILLQYIITSISVRSNFFENVISANPTLLYYNDKLLKDVMKKQRISEQELNKSVREAGFSGFNNILAIVLESTGDITVISKDNSEFPSAMDDIEDFEKYL